MDIGRLPAIYRGYGLPAQTRRPPPPPVPSVQEIAPVQSGQDNNDQVVQGEYLAGARHKVNYGPTSDYLNSRLYEGEAYRGQDRPGSKRSSYANQQAVGAYLSHTQDLIQPDINRGKSVDYFI